MNSFFDVKRPTLPPLRSLNLPIPGVNKGRTEAPVINTTSSNDHCPINDSTSCWSKSSLIPFHPSSCTTSRPSSTSRTPSPTPSNTSSSISIRSGGFRLVPCTMDVADALVLVSEPTENSTTGKALLLIGPAMQPYRQPNRALAKGARVHPYKMATSQSLSRRSSTLSLSES